MPTYDYECKRCGHRFERFQRITDESVPCCPECGAETERIITGGAGLIFKGPGFYATDYRKGEPPEPKKEADSSPSNRTDKESTE